ARATVVFVSPVVMTRFSPSTADTTPRTVSWFASVATSSVGASPAGASGERSIAVTDDSGTVRGPTEGVVQVSASAVDDAGTPTSRSPADVCNTNLPAGTGDATPREAETNVSNGTERVAP